MAITLVGTAQVGTEKSGDSITLTFDGSPAEDDVVVFLVTFANNDDLGAPIAPTTSGYTERGFVDGGVDNFLAAVYTKPLTSSPDATVVWPGSGDPRDAQVAIAYVLRGVDTTTPLDATTVETTGETDNTDLDAITTNTAGAWVIAFAAGAFNNTASGYPTNYSNGVSGAQTDTNRQFGAAATREIASPGSEDPGAFTVDVSGQPSGGLTIAIKPAGGAGTQDITPALASQTIAAVDPTLTTTVDVAPALESQLLAAVDPTLASFVDIAPTLVSQLLAAVDPAVAGPPDAISPSLESQLLAAIDPTLITSVNIGPALVSQLLAAIDPTVGGIPDAITPTLASQTIAGVEPSLTTTVDVAPALVTQAIAGVEPSLSLDIAPTLVTQTIAGVEPTVGGIPDAVTPALVSQTVAGVEPTVATDTAQDIAPTLVSQAVAAVDPALTTTVDVAPTLVSQTVAAVDPALTTGPVDISPSLVSQAIAGVEPSVGITQEISPTLVSQLASPVEPVVTWVEISGHRFTTARFYRQNITGEEKLVLTASIGTAGGTTFKTTGNWEPVSAIFALPVEPRGETKAQAMAVVRDTWLANMDTAVATLTQLINIELRLAGYTRGTGETLTPTQGISVDLVTETIGADYPVAANA